MPVLKSLPAALASLLLAAHFLRSGALPLVLACLVLLALCFVRRPWARITVRSALAAAVAVWLMTAWRLAGLREAAGQPAGRLWLILGAVAAFTAFAAWLLPPAHPEDG